MRNDLSNDRRAVRKKPYAKYYALGEENGATAVVGPVSEIVRLKDMIDQPGSYTIVMEVAKYQLSQ